jgi:hypothetical protein
LSNLHLVADIAQQRRTKVQAFFKVRVPPASTAYDKICAIFNRSLDEPFKFSKSRARNLRPNINDLDKT